MDTTEQGIEIIASKLGAIARQIEANGTKVAEACVAKHYDPDETRTLLVCAMILMTEKMRELDEAS
jgi:hypothetical protein